MKNLLKYISILGFFGLIGLFLLDSVFLTLLVKNKREIYLPDVRQMNLYKGEKILNDLGFNIEIIQTDYNNLYTPNTIMSMSPRAFSKIKKGRTVKITVTGHKKDIVVDTKIVLAILSTTLLGEYIDPTK